MWPPEDEAAAEPRPTAARIVPLAGGLLVIALLVPVRGLWAAQAALMLLLLTVPGVILLRALRVPGRASASFPVYVPAASVAVLMASGLAVDWGGLLSGDATPLRAVPLLIGLEVVCLALLASSARAPVSVTIPWHLLSGRARILWPLVLPLMAAAGAFSLNGRHGSGLAVAAVAVGVIAVTAVASLAQRLTPAQLNVAVFSVALAIAWSYSLRSNLVNGFDISREYYLMHSTELAGVWYTYHPGDAYGAMLSVTLLPAALHQLTGMSGLMLFKLLYPVLYALFPVGIFGIARRILPRRWAFFAATFSVAQYAFSELPSLARQEIAFLFFTVLIAVILDSRMRRSHKLTLAILFSLGITVSHYSTGYVAITITALALPIQWLVGRKRDLPRLSGAILASFLTLFGGAVLWYGPVTHSSQHTIQFIDETLSQGLGFLPNRSAGEGLISAYLHGNTITTMPAAKYEQAMRGDYQTERPYVVPFPDAGSAQYTLRNAPLPASPVSLGPVRESLTAGALILTELANLIAGIGALWLVLSRRSRPVARQAGILMLAIIPLLLVIRLSGVVAAAYGQERAQLQAMILFSITVGWVLQATSSRFRRKQAGVFAAAIACLALLFANTTYLVDAVFGGGTPDNLANSGASYEYFYPTTPELAAARWLGARFRPGALVYADVYAQLPLEAMTGIQYGLLHAVTPLTLDQHAWIFEGRTNVVDGRGFALHGRQRATFAYPSGFIDSHYNLVYTNGSSKVFLR